MKAGTALVLEWRDRKVATKKALIGTLSHAATVVIPGRTFLRRMNETMAIPKRLYHHVRLNQEFQADVQWWASILPCWNGRIIQPRRQPTHSLWSDASGSWGCGALSHTFHWFQVQWPQSWQQCHITAKEMVPVVVAVAVWGPDWHTSTVQAFLDNMAVVCALSAGTARDPLQMHLLRCLHFFCARFRLVIQERQIRQLMPCHKGQHEHLLVLCSSGPAQPLPPPSSSTGHVAAQQARLDIFRLEEAVSHYLSRALASSTLRTYSSGQHRYLSFCEAASVSPLPLSEHTICMFVAWLARDGLVHQTIKSYLLAIRHFHILAGQGDPFAGEAYPILQYVLRGKKRSPARAARQPRLPVTPSIL